MKNGSKKGIFIVLGLVAVIVAIIAIALFIFSGGNKEKELVKCSLSEKENGVIIENTTTLIENSDRQVLKQYTKISFDTDYKTQDLSKRDMIRLFSEMVQSKFGKYESFEYKEDYDNNICEMSISVDLDDKLKDDIDYIVGPGFEDYSVSGVKGYFESRGYVCE